MHMHAHKKNILHKRVMVAGAFYPLTLSPLGVSMTVWWANKMHGLADTLHGAADMPYGVANMLHCVANMACCVSAGLQPPSQFSVHSKQILFSALSGAKNIFSKSGQVSKRIETILSTFLGEGF